MTTLFISHSFQDKQWAERMREALRGQGYQSLFLDSHPDDGIHAGADWEQTLYRRLRQSRGVIVLCTARWLASPWCVAEAMLARERGKRLFLLATPEVADGRQVKGLQDGATAPQIPDFLKDTQFISLAGATEEEACARLWQGLAAEGLKDDFPLPERPYPGLEPFQETDAAVFFGRGEEIERVIGVLNKRRRNNAEGFILVLGASGCGKSSLVRAGVLPRLKRASDQDGAGGRWVIPPPFMGGRGLEGLAHALALAFKDAGQPRELAFVRQQLEAATRLRLLAGELLVARGIHEGYLLLVLDQLEEVFGTDAGSGTRAMLRLLLEASADAASPVVVLATMRSDFLNAFQLFEGAAERYEEVTLDPMPRSRFGEVIEGPANRFGLRLGAGLTERLVEDTHYDDALPLLAYTLERLYTECCAEGALTLKQYEKLFPEVKIREEDGTQVVYRGVSAAIKHVADKILSDTEYASRLPAADSRMRDLRRAFYSLAQVGEEGQFTRRTARWSLMPVSCADVLQRFVKDRLLVSGKNDNGQPILSVTHEALFRVWDTLNGWLLQDRKALALRARIEDAAAEWVAENRAESRAWPEERILDAVREIDKSGVSLADVKDRVVVDAFLGPTDPSEIARLLGLGAAEDAMAGSGRYGDAWRLPLGHEARASVGVRLALLGDPRCGVGLRADGLPDIDWRRIEGGEVTIDIRMHADNPNSAIIKRLTRTVDTFWIGRFPITVSQFEAFLRECYKHGAWLLPEDCPVKYTPDTPQPPYRAPYSNYPIDSINYFDAIAFCYWLSKRLGFDVHLPTEFQWQLAANAGKLALNYPWGLNWDPYQETWRANTQESGLKRSTAVGLYPQGASPTGVLDMAGNVWDLCGNAFLEPDNTRFATCPNEPRVLRGGSWVFPKDNARLTNRGWIDLPLRSANVGFRVLCSAPIE